MVHHQHSHVLKESRCSVNTRLWASKTERATSTYRLTIGGTTRIALPHRQVTVKVIIKTVATGVDDDFAPGAEENTAPGITFSINFCKVGGRTTEGYFREVGLTKLEQGLRFVSLTQRLSGGLCVQSHNHTCQQINRGFKTGLTNQWRPKKRAD